MRGSAKCGTLMKLVRFFRFLIAGLFSLGVSCAASAQTAEPIHLNVSLDETEIYIGGADDKKSDGLSLIHI